LKRRKLVSFKIGEVRIDIYDYTALDHMLEWMSKLAAPTSSKNNQSNPPPRAVDKIKVVYKEDKGPEFLRDNPWIKVLLSRGRERL